MSSPLGYSVFFKLVLLALKHWEDPEFTFPCAHISCVALISGLQHGLDSGLAEEIGISPDPRPDPRNVAHSPPPAGRAPLPSRMCKAAHMSAPALPGQLEKKPGCLGGGGEAGVYP